MRILFITQTLGICGGIQRVTCVKANQFVKSGHNVAIAFTDRLGWPEKSTHPLSDQVKVYDMDSPFWDRNRKRFDFLYRYPAKAIRLRNKIKGVISDFKPDIVISTGQFEKFVLPFVKPFGRKFAIIREYHFASNYRQTEQLVRYGKITWKPRLINWFEDFVLSRLFDCNFLLTREDMESNRHPARKYDYMWNPASFAAVDESTIDSTARTVIAAGRLTAQKNFTELIKIWAKTERQDWTLKILGDGDDFHRLQQLSKDLGIEDSVILTGHTSKVQEEMQKAAIYAATSTFEGFMLTLGEAMSQGCTIVSFRTPYGPTDIIEDGISGFLTEMHDTDTFAQRLSQLIRDADLRDKMRRKALARSRALDVERICGQWIEKYTAILEKRRLLHNEL